MGKSHLLEWLCEDSKYAFCTATQFINRHDPRTLLGDADVLVIDALDEVVAQRDGDALDRVLKQLGKAGYPRFVLSCRVADWRSAIGRQAIRDQYASPPLELHLEPFSDEDAVRFLAAHLGKSRATEVVAHYNMRGLQGLLGNPQTLEMIAKVAASGKLPETKSQLFSRSTDILSREHKDNKAEQQLPPELAISTAGAAFASLILTGQEMIVRKPAASIQVGEVLPADIARLPGAEKITGALDTRLFKARGPDRFTYCHRRIAEYQAAHWLANLANTSRKRRRLLSLFHQQGVVPASLRGLHAWLAQDTFLAEAVISADPMGVIEYGDADTLDAKQARALLNGLIRISDENPNFYGWGGYSLRGLARTELLNEIRSLILASDTCFGLRMILLEAVTGSGIGQALAPDLLTLMFDEQTPYAIRSQAVTALIQSNSNEPWAKHIKQLSASKDEQSIRLALNLLHDVGYAAFDDHTIAETAMACARLTQRTMGLLWRTREKIPQGRAAGVLEQFLTMARTLGGPRDRPGNVEITRFACHLIARILNETTVDPLRLWSWLSPFLHQLVAGLDSSTGITRYLKSNPSARRTILHEVLLGAVDANDMRERGWTLSGTSPELNPTNDDIIDILSVMPSEDASDLRWQALVLMIEHDGEAGADVRKAAHRFTAERPDHLAWLESLENPPIPQWKIEENEREQRRATQREVEREKRRSTLLPQIQSMRAGEFETIVDSALVYLNMLIGSITDLPAHQRLEDWLGTDLAEVAIAGFEAYLTNSQTSVTAMQIADACAHDKSLYASYILIAAIAERRRRDQGVDDLSDERLLACLFSLRTQRFLEHIGLNGLDTIVEQTVRKRDLWPQSLRMLYEPQFSAGKSGVEGLHQLMHSEQDAELASYLAVEWLCNFPTLSEHSEMELVDHLLRHNHYDKLRTLARDRPTTDDSARERRWQAIGLIADFDVARQFLDPFKIDPELLWPLRDLTHMRHSGNAIPPLDTLQREWIITNFRESWQYVDDPAHRSRNDKSPWDASGYITSLIQQLGNDTSEAATDALLRLCDAPEDSYTAKVREVISEQTRKRVDAFYAPQTMDAVLTVLNDLPPASAADLQSYVLEVLDTIGAKARSDDIDSWQGFYGENNVPHDEERCRNHLIGLLRQETQAVTFDPEGHVANDKEIDIACRINSLLLPIEVKGQWHNKLWVAADEQLDRLYTPDWRASGHGIYLILWFGDSVPENKKLMSPGKGSVKPSTPHQLREQIIERSKAAKSGRVSVVVLDLSRKSPS